MSVSGYTRQQGDLFKERILEDLEKLRVFVQILQREASLDEPPMWMSKDAVRFYRTEAGMKSLSIDLCVMYAEDMKLVEKVARKLALGRHVSRIKLRKAYGASRSMLSELQLEDDPLYLRI